MKNLFSHSNNTLLNQIFALLIGLLFTTNFLNAQAMNSFEGVDGVDLQVTLCEYWDGDNTTAHYLEDYIGLCDTINVKQESNGTTLGFTTYFEPTGGTGFTDSDAFGIANQQGVHGETGAESFDGSNAFVMSDVDGIIKMRFDAVDLTGTTNPIFSMRGWINSTSWELQDSIRISMIITGCAAATTVDILNTTGQDIDGNYNEEAWDLHTLDLAPYIGCETELEIMFSSNQSSEIFAIDSIFFTEGNIPTALPVELVHFNAADQGERVTLDWRTATELNNEGFQIERSIDGSNWENIGFVRGKGTTELMNSYSFIDDTPTKGNNYYRLKQMDFDGAYEYSSIVNVLIDKEETPFTVFPNPVRNNQLNITFEKQPESNTMLRLYSFNGQLLSQTIINDYNTKLNLSDYASGMYIVEISSGNEVWQERIVK